MHFRLYIKSTNEEYNDEDYNRIMDILIKLNMPFIMGPQMPSSVDPQIIALTNPKPSNRTKYAFVEQEIIHATNREVIAVLRKSQKYETLHLTDNPFIFTNQKRPTPKTNEPASRPKPSTRSKKSGAITKKNDKQNKGSSRTAKPRRDSRTGKGNAKHKPSKVLRVRKKNRRNP